MFAHLRFTTPRTALPAAVALVISVRVGLAQAPPPMQPVTYAIKNLGTLCVPTPDLACEVRGPAPVYRLQSSALFIEAAHQRFLSFPGRRVTDAE